MNNLHQSDHDTQTDKKENLMMKKKNIPKRFLAVCVCLIVVLSACASVDVPSDNSVTTEESKATSALELSEVNAESTSSEAEPSEEVSESESSAPDEHISADDNASLAGDITITPIEPVIPEERETTLELVKEYPLGEGGIPFAIEEGENPAFTWIKFPGWFFADEKGNIYSFTGNIICDLQTGETLDLDFDGLLIYQMIALDGKIYGLDSDGILKTYTMKDGKVGSVGYPKGDDACVFVSPDGELSIGVNGMFYNESRERVVWDCVPEKTQNQESVLNVSGRRYCYTEDIYIQNYANGILTAYERTIHRKETFLPDQGPKAEVFYEYIMYQYDKSGDPLSEFMICRYFDPKEIPCSISYDGLECTSYNPITYTVGDRVFENLLDGEWFVGADGTIYLMLIDPDGGKLYKINPGYSDVEFTDYGAEREIQ